MSESGFDKQAEAVTLLVSDLYEVDAVYRQGEELVFSLSWRYAPVRSKKLLVDRLTTAGYRFTVTEGEQVVLQIDPRRRLRIPKLNIILFFITLLSIYVVPVFMRHLNGIGVAEPVASRPGWLGEVGVWFSVMGQLFSYAWGRTVADLSAGAGVEFTVAMVSMLLVHEMGHFVASRRRQIVTTWPYFIPAPNIIGSFGAVIKSKSPFRNRRDLLEVGAAGPIAGWVVAVGWLVYGLVQSEIAPISTFVPSDWVHSLEGESILMRVLTLGILGEAPAGYAYRLSEAAFAGWVGLLVTAINMLPIGQLDGGHIVYGLIRRYQHVFGFLALAALLVLGFQSLIWWVFGAMTLVVGVGHPPTLNDGAEPSRTSRLMGLAALVILLLSFTPVPFPTPF